jgi:hypothetical protein
MRVALNRLIRQAKVSSFRRAEVVKIALACTPVGTAGDVVHHPVAGSVRMMHAHGASCSFPNIYVWCGMPHPGKKCNKG